MCGRSDEKRYAIGVHAQDSVPRTAELPDSDSGLVTLTGVTFPHYTYDDTTTPDRLGLHCGVQIREGPSIASRRLGPP